MKRRHFLKRFVYSLVVIIGASLPYGMSRLLAPATRSDRNKYLRPPGALADDAAFIKACIGCGACGEVCPPRCIEFYQRSGGSQVNTPFINPEDKGCILCGYCMEVCPTNALTVTPRNEISMGIAQIDRSACYPWVDRGVCGACVSVCPLGETAIGFDFANFYRPVVQKGCVGCGLCVEVCPEPSLPIRIVEMSGSTVTPHRI